MRLVEIVQKLNEKEWLCLCFCSNKEDATTDVSGIIGDVTLAEGSLLYTSDMQIAVLNSSNEWVWKE